MGQIIYKWKWIVDKSELKTESESKKNLGRPANNSFK